MATMEELQANLNLAEQSVSLAWQAINAFVSAIENNVFESVDDASATIEERFQQKARDACEGSYCFGLSEYTQEFIVDGVHYMAKMTVEYNRHDKTYYYVDGTEFSVSPL